MLTIPQEIKDILHLDSAYKNIRIHFPNGERSDICNDLIVKDSVSFTESLCSQNTLKFGLCESPVFECEVVGVGNIKDATIEVFCEIECDSAVEDSVFRRDLQKYVYPISYGSFTVDEAKRQADMQHRKIVAYGGTAVFNKGISNRLEFLKTHYMPGPWSSVVYEPNAFLLAMSNIGLNNYSDTIFNTTDLSWPLTSGTDDIYSNTWEYNGEEIRVVAYPKYYSSSENLSQKDALFYLNYTIDEDVLDQAVKDIISFGKTYGMPNNMDASFWKRRLKSISCIFSVSGEGYMEKSLLNFAPPFIFYPYFNSSTSMHIDGYLGKVRIEKYSGGTVIDSITLDAKYVDDVVVKKLEVKNPKLNDLTIPFTWVKTGSGGYDRAFLPPEDYDNIEILQKLIELSGVFGYTKRNNSLDFLNIKQQFHLNPDDELYPGSNLYPQGVTGGELYPEDYQSCWYDDNYTIPFGAIQCSYKNTNNEDVLYIYYLSGFNANSNQKSYRIYDFSDNEYIKSSTWTEAQIQGFCEDIAANLEGVTYMPIDFVGRGLPYVEAGDTFEILTKSNESITTIVLNRTLTGEQTLTDSYKSV